MIILICNNCGDINSVHVEGIGRKCKICNNMGHAIGINGSPTAFRMLSNKEYELQKNIIKKEFKNKEWERIEFDPNPPRPI